MTKHFSVASDKDVFHRSLLLFTFLPEIPNITQQGLTLTAERAARRADAARRLSEPTGAVFTLKECY